MYLPILNVFVAESSTIFGIYEESLYILAEQHPKEI